MNPNQENNGLPPLPTEFGGQPKPQPITQPIMPVSVPQVPVTPQAIVPLAQNNDAPPMPVSPTPQSVQPIQPVGLPPIMPAPVEPPKPPIEVRSSRASDWNSTPWVVGIFFMIVLVAVLALVALNLYSQPLGGNTTTSSSTTSSSVQAFVLTSATYNTSTSNWSYQVDGTLPTPCHTATVEAVIRESFPEQVSINVLLAPPAGDIACVQVIDEVTLTGTFTASDQAVVTLGTVTTATDSN